MYEDPNLIDLLSIPCCFVNMQSFFFFIIYTATYPAKVPPTPVLMPATWNSSDIPNINIIIYVKHNCRVKSS